MTRAGCSSQRCFLGKVRCGIRPYSLKEANLSSEARTPDQMESSID